MQTAALAEEESDEEETFRDLHGPDSESEGEEAGTGQAQSSWLHRAHNPGYPPSLSLPPPSIGTGWEGAAKAKGDYDPEARNPLFANAEKGLPFELALLARHFHPSVALFASTLLQV